MLVRRRISTRGYLVAFSLALVVPIVAFGTAALFYYAAVERGRLERQAEQIARQIGIILDGNVSNLHALLRGLASSSALLQGDLAEFQAQASRLVQDREQVIVLRTLGSEQLINTQVAYGAKLPPAVPLTAEEQASFRTGALRVSDVYASPISGEPRVAVAFQPLPKEKPDYLLALTVPTSRFLEAIRDAVPANWIVGVGDRNGTFVTRSAQHEEFSGRPGLPSYLEKAVGRSGTFYAENYARVSLLAGYYRTDLTDWLVGANIPTELLEAPLRRSLLALAVAAAAVISLCALLAFLFSRRLGGAAAALAARAETVGSGAEVAPLNSGISEFAVIDRALTRAAAVVHERAALTQNLIQANDQKDLLLKEVNHRVKNSLQLVASLLNLQRSSIKDPEARQQFEASARRINTVAQIHQRLYRDEHPDKVALDAFLGELCEELNVGFLERNVRIACAVTPSFMPTERIIPVALIVNELIMNALKYSFDGRDGGVIRVESRNEAAAIVISVADDGVSLPAGFDPARSQGLGMKMVTALTRQLRATFHAQRSSAGKVFVLRVPIEDKPSHAS